MHNETKLVPFSVLYKPKRQNHFKTKPSKRKQHLRKKGEEKEKRTERNTTNNQPQTIVQECKRCYRNKRKIGTKKGGLIKPDKHFTPLHLPAWTLGASGP